MTEFSENNSICIIGAGLSGSLLAILLAKQGYVVQVFEKRPDPRFNAQDSGRSINLALSHRGIKALAKAGLDQEVLKIALPMHGRSLHDQDQKLTFVAYGSHSHEYINSISRGELNQFLIQKADHYPQVSFYFEHEVEKVDLEGKTLQVRSYHSQEQFTLKSPCFLAADGAGSVVRRAMEAQENYQSRSEFLDYGYKELSIPAAADQSFQLAKNVLHIWPRGEFMLIALPNLDGSFTATLFLANEGPVSFAELESSSQILAFFQKYFPDAEDKMPDLLQEFEENPVGTLGTVYCQPWSYQNNFLLIGDAAHAIVPFYGQGMNASFEDVRILAECIEEFKGEWAKVIPAYEKQRKVNTDAIAQLAIENFYEMRDGGAEEAFLRKRALEHKLEEHFPDYYSKYSLVTFHPNIPYSEAHRRGNLQNDFLLDLCRNINSIESLNISEVYQQMKDKEIF